MKRLLTFVVMLLLGASIYAQCGVCPGVTRDLTVTAMGTAPYSYTWSGPNSYTNTSTNNSSNSHTVTVTDAGTYTVDVVDAWSCTYQHTFTVPSSSPPVLTVTATNGTCGGTGSIDLTVTGGSTYTYSWTGPGTYTATTEDISNLADGTYTVVVTDTDSDCTETASATIANNPAMTGSGSCQ